MADLPLHVAADAAHLLELLRAGTVATKPEVVTETGWGRTVVNQRVGLLLDAGLVDDGEVIQQTGRGRSPRGLRFRPDAGHVVGVSMGNHRTLVGRCDLLGRVGTVVELEVGAEHGHETVLPAVLGAVHDLDRDVPQALWGIGAGLPSPVEFRTGRIANPKASMPGWQDVDLRALLTSEFDVPVWLDNDANVMALGELRSSHGAAADLVLLKVGTWLGAGLVGGGRLQRGAVGSAGEIAHIVLDPESDLVCSCGRRGCVAILASGISLARQGAAAAEDGRSPALAERLAQHGEITGTDVLEAADRGDGAAVEIVTTAGRRLGEVAAYLVSILNPDELVLGGGLGQASDLLLARLREVVYAECLPLATRDLRIRHTALGRTGGVVGAAHLVLDELHTPARVSRWLAAGTPASMPALVDV